MKIIRVSKTGFCFGVKRALDIVMREANEAGGTETLGQIVHNRTVLDDLAKKGVKTVGSVDEISGKTVVTGAHGVTPEVGEALTARGLKVVDTTCPFVKRAQETARRLAESEYFVVVYGEAEHPEVQGILGWAGGKGLAATDTSFIEKLSPLPRAYRYSLPDHTDTGWF